MASKVISFRADEALSQQIEHAKQLTGMSYGDAIKRGYDICVAELQGNLNRINKLSKKIAELEEIIEEKEFEAERSLEQEKELRRQEMNKRFRNEELIHEEEMTRQERELNALTQEVSNKAREKQELESQIKRAKLELKETTDTLAKLQERCGEHQMMNFMMMLTMMGATSDMLQLQPQRSATLPQKCNGVNPQQSMPISYNYLEQVQPSAPPALATTITGLLSLLPIFMMASMMSSITKPAKKKPIEHEAPRRTLEELIRSSREATEQGKPKLEVAKPKEVLEEEGEDEEAEEQQETAEEELDED
jgi:hypothetical protein